MKYNPDKHHRRSIRLQGYDYSQAGAYFVTICTQNYECMFGDIVDGEMVLNDAGRMVHTVWYEIPRYYSGIDIDAFQIMPNHIHGIVIVIVGAGPRACPESSYNTGQSHDGETLGRQSRDEQSRGGQSHDGQPRGDCPYGGLSLPDVVHRFKTMTTKRYTDGVKQHGWIRFDRQLWQRNYYEHIVRNEKELKRIREYIIHNPAKWESDRLYKPTLNIPDMIREPSPEYAVEGWMI